MMKTTHYGSHKPVLTRLCKNHEIKNILELGVGFSSTFDVFSRWEIWKNPKCYLGIDDNKEWLDKINTAIFMNHVEFHDHAIFAYKSEIRLYLEKISDEYINEFDMIFVDCCTTTKDRVLVLETLLPKVSNSLVVVHDAQKPEYLNLIKSHMEGYLLYTGLMPWTALAWNGLQARNLAKKFLDNL